MNETVTFIFDHNNPKIMEIAFSFPVFVSANNKFHSYFDNTNPNVFQSIFSFLNCTDMQKIRLVHQFVQKI